MIRTILGAALLRSGRPDEAVTELRAAGESPTARCRCGIGSFLLAIACAKAGRTEEARRWFETCATRGPLLGRGIGFTIAEIRMLRTEAAELLGLPAEGPK
jgi:hypothetical protein